MLGLVGLAAICSIPDDFGDGCGFPVTDGDDGGVDLWLVDRLWFTTPVRGSFVIFLKVGSLGVDISFLYSIYIYIHGELYPILSTVGPLHIRKSSEKILGGGHMA